jgi:hypothetical protein
MEEELKSTDNGERDLEREIEDRFVAMRGTPMQTPAYLREFMRAMYAARAAEKAAQTGRVDGMKPAPHTPGVGEPRETR